MDVIRKIISMDSIRNHENGILPFIKYNSGDEEIKTVNPGNTNGNYGQFVCDFVFKNGDKEEPVISMFDVTFDTALTASNSTNIATTSNNDIIRDPRMKYLDALRRYRESKEIMESGILVKRYEEHDSACTPTYTGATYWSTKFINDGECHPEQERFGAKMAKLSDFTVDFNGNYIYEDTASTPTDEYLLLVDGYDTTVLYNNIWIDWWEKYWLKDTTVGPLSGWGVQYFSSNYEEPKFDCYRFIWDFERYILGKIYVPENNYSYDTTGVLSCSAITGTKVPKFVYFNNYGEYINRLDKEKKGSDKWKELGGQEFRDFLASIKVAWKSIRTVPDGEVGLIYEAPEIEIPIFFEQECKDETLYSPYEYTMDLLTPQIDSFTVTFDSTTSVTVNNGSSSSILNTGVEGVDYVSAVKNYNSATTFTLMESGTTLYPHFSLAISGYAESKIDTLDSIDVLSVCEDLTGRFAQFPSGLSQMYECVYNGSAWTYAVSTATGLTCADGETDIKAGDKKYRNATIAACIEGMEPKPQQGGTYYIRARYANDINNPFTYPFKYGEPCNVSTIDELTTIYDMITGSAITGNKMTVDYVLGVTSGVSIDKSGIHYTEDFLYESGVTETYIDDVYKAQLYYEKVSNSGLTEEMYNSDLRLTRTVKLAKITGMEVGSVWTPETACSALLFSKDGAENLQEEPIYDIDVEFDRGLATAWESHFKLSECNTMEDLENYGNNIFNL